MPLVLAMIADGLIALAFECREHLPRLGELAKTYADRKPDLADLCLIRMSKRYPRHSVITVERGDFRVYRRNNGRRSRSSAHPERANRSTLVVRMLS